MTIKFDFDLPEARGVVSGVSAGATSSVIVTVPLASAPFPLQSGRIVEIEYEVRGFDSNGGLVAGRGRMVTGPATSSYPSNYYDTATLAGTQSSGIVLHMNASGDLEVSWTNNNAGGSGISQDVAVRVKAKLVGA